MGSRLLLTWVLVGMLSGGVAAHGQDPGPQTSSPAEDTANRTVRVRLPAYFSAVVSAPQREEIYKLLRAYVERIEMLQRQIAELEIERDKAVDGVLTPDQLAQVQRRRAEAAERRRARGRAATAREGDPPREQ